MSARIQKLAEAARRTPLHPQWFSFLHEDRNLQETCAKLDGIVLDVGSAHARPRRFMPPAVNYIALDYFSTASEWYGTRPDLYGDAQSLPVQNNSIDHALLLDVLEHLPDPHRSLAELHRVLKPGGSLTIQVPFLYPLHDEPLDFHRWTRHGLRQAAVRHGYNVEVELAIGHPLESAALNANIAISKTVLNWARSWNPLALTGLLLPFAVLITNIGAWGFARLGQEDDFMPHSYRVVWTKN